MGENEPTFRSGSLLAHAGWVRGLARALVVDESQVDDVVQETWVAAMQNPPPRTMSLRAWLAGVARNVARQGRRRDARRFRRERQCAKQEALPSAEQLVAKAEMQRRVVEAVLDLDEPYRSTLLLRYFEELPAEEIARRLHVPGSTVRNRLRRALARIRGRFDQQASGDRRAWCLAMIPLAAPSSGVREALVAGAAATSVSSTLAGGKTAMTAKGMILGAAVLVFGGAAGFVVLQTIDDKGAGEPRDATPAVDAARGAGEQDTEAAAGEQRIRVPAANVVHLIRGRVTDSTGQPVVGARVFVGAHQNPFPGAATAAGHIKHQEVEGGATYWSARPPDVRRKRGILLGRTVETDVDGRYEVRFPDSQRVFLRLLPGIGIRSESGEGSWSQTPSPDANLRARRIPTAKIAVTLVDQSTGQRVEKFQAKIDRGQRRVRPTAVEAAVLERTLELPDGQPTSVAVSIVEPAWAKTSKDVLLTPGAVRKVELFARSTDTLTGRIVAGALKTPVGGALVYWGDQTRMRGNRRHGHFDAERIQDGVRTDSQGVFVLKGSAGEITVWHPDYSPVTLSTQDASTIALPARGTVRGRVLGENGIAESGIEVLLDRHLAARTDTSGDYTFANVEAGEHAVRVGDRRQLAVRVEPAETVQIDHSKVMDEIEVQVLSGGKPYRQRFGAGLMGTGRVYTMHEFGTRDGLGKLRGVYPGRYVAVSGGRFAVFDVSPGKKAIAELGTASLTVRTEPNTTIHLQPLGVPDLARVPQGWFQRRVPASGQVTISPLPLGRYRIGRVRGRSTTMQLAQQSQTIVLQ